MERLGTSNTRENAVLLTCIFTAPEDIEFEDLNYYYANYSRYVNSYHRTESPTHSGLSIYNDVITLRKGSSYM